MRVFELSDFNLLASKPGYSLRMAAKALGFPPSRFCGQDGLVARFDREGMAGIFPKHRSTIP